MDRGLFITFEGIDGCGKTTQAQLFSEYLKYQGREHCFTREPGGSEGSEAIRRLLKEDKMYHWTPLSQFFLFMAGRHQHVMQTIIPALNQGVWVICDRFSDSTHVYQGHFLKTFSPDMIAIIAQHAAENLIPDLTFIVDIEPTEAQSRLCAREPSSDTDAYDALVLDEACNLRRRFLERADRDLERCHVINGHGSVTEVHLAIVQMFQECYERKMNS